MLTPKSTSIVADSYEYIKQFADNQFTVGIIDPPYAINATKMQMGSAPNRKGKGQYPGISTNVKLKGRLNSGGGTLKNRPLNQSEIDWDNELPPDYFWEHFFRVTQHQIIFGGNYFPLPPTRGIICWDKKQSWENFSQWEMIWTSYDCPAKMYRISNTGGDNKDKKINPTQKPIKLYDKLYHDFKITSGMSVLDTHEGSGSNRIAAYKAGVDYFGIEKRHSQHIDQQERFAKFLKNYCQPTFQFP